MNAAPGANGGENGARSAVALFVLLSGIWLLASGHYTPLFYGFGLGSVLLVVFLCRRMGLVDAEAVPVHLVARGLVYVPWIAWEVAKSNVDVARRVLSPRSALSPEVFVLNPTQKTDLGRVLYANSITLTPGTVSIEAEDGTITVHAIAGEVADSLREGTMDRRVARLEGLQ
jgi:multicomponent Na+:H+ antiporter subunit E